MSTTLAARRTRAQPPQHSTALPNNREQAATGRVIGSAVRVLVERDWNHDRGLSVDTEIGGLHEQRAAAMRDYL